MASIIQVRRDTAANWTSANPILALGEQGFETDTLKLKYGDGATAWNSLSYYAAGATLSGLSDTDITAPGKGSTLVYDGLDWIDVGVGADGEVLTADTAEDSGVKWSDTAGGGLTVTEEIADFTLDLTQAGGYIRLVSQNRLVVTVPTDANAAFPTGTEITIFRAMERNQIVAEPGVNISSEGEWMSPGATSVTLIKTGSNAWDISGGLTNVWDISTGVYEGKSTPLQTNPVAEDLTFRPDGLKMYVIDSGRVYEYDLSTAWDLTSYTYIQEKSISGQDTKMRTVQFRPDGLKMYTAGQTNDRVYEYDLSTAWDVSSVVYFSELPIASQETSVTGIFFKPDGLKMYVVGLSGKDVNEYDLGTAWSVTSAVFVAVSDPMTLQPEGIFFKPDGLKMYIARTTISSGVVVEYNLSTAWDVLSMGGQVSSYSYPDGVSKFEGVYIEPTGTNMYIVSDSLNAVFDITLVP